MEPRPRLSRRTTTHCDWKETVVGSPRTSGRIRTFCSAGRKGRSVPVPKDIDRKDCSPGAGQSPGPANSPAGSGYARGGALWPAPDPRAEPSAPVLRA